MKREMRGGGQESMFRRQPVKIEILQHHRR